MKKALLFFIMGTIFALSFASLVSANVDPGTANTMATAPNCVKGKYSGDASTYNPYKPGWRSGGGTLATGGPYDPNSWSAALQLDVARQLGCGYGSGKVCNAAVEANGRTAVVMINDNGPLVPGRIIDLNEKSMDYLSGGNVAAGVLKNVTVTVLCTADYQFLGPVNESDRQAWLQKTFGGIPATPVGQSTVFNNAGLYNTAGLYAGAQYNGLAPMMAPNQFQQPLTPASQVNYAQPSYPQTNTTYAPQNGQANSYSANMSPPVQGASPALSLRVWPHSLSHGQTLLVYWTSVNMAQGSCQVQSQSQQFAQSNEGAKPFPTTSFDSGTLSFTLQCTDDNGRTYTSSDSATLTQ